MKAIVIDKLKKASVHDIAEFKSRPNYLRLKVHAVALNPTDWKHIDLISEAGAVVGCDIAGVVEEVGPEVKTNVKVGDRIAAVVHGSNLSNHEDGGFAERAMVKDGAFMHIPDSMSFEEAASLPVGVGTVGQGLYQSLRMPSPLDGKPTSPPTPILIYGGSTATGTLAIQYAVLSGLEVLTTASPRNNALLKSLGAKEVFDYNDKDCGKKINEYTGDKLRYVFDCITDEQSYKISSEALSSSTANGELISSALLSLANYPRSDVTSRYTLLYNALGEPYTKFGRERTPDPQEYVFIRDFYKMSEKLLAEGKIKPHPIQVGSGFEGILDGLDKMRKGEYSAKKLVYTLV